MRIDTCKHFNGIQHGKCEAGVPYDQFRREGLSMLKTLPCTRLDTTGTCAKWEAPSAEELKAYEAEVALAISNVLKLDRMISEGAKSGEFPCHCGGMIRFQYQGPLSASAKCSKCDWSMIS